MAASKHILVEALKGIALAIVFFAAGLWLMPGSQENASAVTIGSAYGLELIGAMIFLRSLYSIYRGRAIEFDREQRPPSETGLDAYERTKFP